MFFSNFLKTYLTEIVDDKELAKKLSTSSVGKRSLTYLSHPGNTQNIKVSAKKVVPKLDAIKLGLEAKQKSIEQNSNLRLKDYQKSKLKVSLAKNTINPEENPELFDKLNNAEKFFDAAISANERAKKAVSTTFDKIYKSKVFPKDSEAENIIAAQEKEHGVSRHETPYFQKALRYAGRYPRSERYGGRPGTERPKIYKNKRDVRAEKEAAIAAMKK